MTIGFAAISTSLTIAGKTTVNTTIDDFKVYFSDVNVNGVQDLSLVDSETSLVFNKELSAVGQNIVITYDITNASKNYDADVNITCTQSTEYLTINNSFDTSTNLSARSTRTGTLSITLSKSYTGADLTQDISCTINASAVERTSQGSGTVNAPLDKYYIGREISIGEEKFNIISTTDDTVTMLAKYNIGEDYIQSEEPYYVQFSDYIGWTNTPGPKEIDIQYVDGETKTLLNNYVSYLNREYNAGATGDLISLKELKTLGCTINDAYSYIDGLTCEDSIYASWILNGQWWWTRSARTNNSECIWSVSDSEFTGDEYYFHISVRPVITISKEALRNLG